MTVWSLVKPSGTGTELAELVGREMLRAWIARARSQIERVHRSMPEIK